MAIAAVVVTFLLALAVLRSALQHPVLVIIALVPALAGISILRRRVWGAYGLTVFFLAQAAITPVVLPLSATPIRLVAVLTALSVGLAVFFFLAGRSLATAGAERGAVYPWVAVSCLFTVPFLFIRTYAIPTGSMEDTLLLGDKVMVRTFPRVLPARGDIIVFRYPVDHSQTFVKRVIGMPRDRIKLVNNVVYCNGVKLHEAYLSRKMQLPNSYAENFPSERPRLMGKLDPFLHDMFEHHIVNGELVVPANKYFTLGDNRDNSLDSRYWGFVDPSEVIGKPLLIYDSEVPNGVGTDPHMTSIQRVRWNRIFKGL